ncbi:RNase adapter RapZ [Parashewanella curva]|uniref:RNase adapter RapZ n=1 Tax=Parashewanella curva TaxID=2338552 RepID=A0A3L8Q1T2_9GAMM|nr:RNase adapter RapZ [Parashewanella curva]RLV60272.1 RNase adapter RapZ [Parashewanella curva]
MKLVIVSGRSGSGKSVALKVLEDLGYYCVDNLPMTLLGGLIEELKPSQELVAISVDVRNLPEQDKVFERQLKSLTGIEILSFFISSSDDVLLKRYTETRRLHPLAYQCKSLPEAIRIEGELLSGMSKMMDHFIDTSESNAYQLSDKIREILLGRVEQDLVINVESFGFKHGRPKDADFMFDVRFLPNPHWEETLRPFTGLDKPVQDFLNAQPEVNKFIWQIANLIDTWLPQLERNNRSYLTIAIGCTGGQHRSVFIVEQLAEHLRKNNRNVEARHKELTNADT